MISLAVALFGMPIKPRGRVETWGRVEPPLECLRLHSFRELHSHRAVEGVLLRSRIATPPIELSRQL